MQVKPHLLQDRRHAALHHVCVGGGTMLVSFEKKDHTSEGLGYAGMVVIDFSA